MMMAFRSVVATGLIFGSAWTYGEEGAPQTYVIEAPDIVTIEAKGLPLEKAHLVQGNHLVRPDGTIPLGLYGSVNLSGNTLKQAETTINSHLQKWVKPTQSVEVCVTVRMFNSKSYLIVRPGKEGEKTVRRPFTGNETVLDAIAPLEGLTGITDTERIEIVRGRKVLEVDWRAITLKGNTATNYELKSGDIIRIVSRSRKDN